MAKPEDNENYLKVKTPQTLMSEVDYKQTCQTEIDQMSALVERYQNLDPVRVVELGDKVIKYCTPNLMTLDRVWNLFHAEPVTIQWILNFEKNEKSNAHFKMVLLLISLILPAWKIFNKLAPKTAPYSTLSLFNKYLLES